MKESSPETHLKTQLFPRTVRKSNQNLFTQKSDFGDAHSESKNKLSQKASPNKIVIKTRGISDSQKINNFLDLKVEANKGELKKGEKRNQTTPSSHIKTDGSSSKVTKF